jgi:hypothetical protein
MTGLALGVFISGIFLIVFSLLVTEMVNLSVYGRLIGKRYLEDNYAELNAEDISFMTSSAALMYYSQNIMFIDPHQTLFGDYVICGINPDTHSGIVIRGSELHHLIERRIFEYSIPIYPYGEVTEVEPI